MPEEIKEDGPVEAIPGQGVMMLHEVIMAVAKPEEPPLYLYHVLLRDYDGNPLRLEDDFDDLDYCPNEGCSDVDG
jgi:hypothetical protein